MNASIGSFQNCSKSAVVNFTFTLNTVMNISRNSDGNLTTNSCSGHDDNNSTNTINTTGSSNLIRSQGETRVCDHGFEIYRVFIREKYSVLYLDALLALAVVILNIILISVLLRKSNISVVNIFMSILGLSDTCCALFMCLPVAIGIITKNIPVDWMWETYPGSFYVFVMSPYCSAYDTTLILADMFHTMSWMITTCMCWLKAVIIMYPLKSRLCITRRFAVIVCAVILVLCVGIFLPMLMGTAFKPSLLPINFCCWEVKGFYQSYISYHDWFISVTYTISFIIMIVSSMYITLKLTVLRTNIQKDSHFQTQGKTRRAALIILVIVMVYILAESAPATCTISRVFTKSWAFCRSPVHQYKSLMQLLGFASNFIIYSIMGEELRTQIFALLRFRIFRRKKAVSEISGTKSTAD